MPLAADLWEENTDLARASLDHPFVQGIGSGQLALASFKIYVGQDAVFLEAFIRAYALALAKAPDQEGLHMFKDLLLGVFDELSLHRGFAERWGADLSPAPLPSTRAYTDFLLSISGLEPVGHIAAAMTPCMRLYAWLGQTLKTMGQPGSPYREWVEAYSDPALDTLVARLENLLDRYGGDEARIRSHYRTAMELELGFFEGAWKAGQ
ncbi:MAG: TenA family protein [Pseudomonadota bacterium]